ncbi:MAG: hypothetical protein HON76_16840 [Candidatus Scalindua sp.]|jgi:hypothetical protein|nr:hypothetical protein [Candidatus Scalindua sp.]MBT5306344.1 hypothetical protein [Candidatus Scalindua sp.]MBT6047622.1 hypothetical protein [Candidatus Scalindua sp.]MBT6230666.1 hypothetical protein [Candidatus Scalindua sp.]MBT6564184.1 hypothetical protein [Candidatus Scalindua sp.]
MEWSINKGSHACFLCEKIFPEEEVYLSALYDVNNTFERKDFCIECCDKKDDENIFSYWKTKISKKPEKVERYAKIDVFYDLFNKLENEKDLSRVNFRYVLSLYLLRKKVLKLITTRKSSDSEYLLLHNVKEGNDTEVLKPQLSKEEVLAVTDEIGKLVNFTP